VTRPFLGDGAAFECHPKCGKFRDADHAVWPFTHPASHGRFTTRAGEQIRPIDEERR
jgi:hypothetical protein